MEKFGQMRGKRPYPAMPSRRRADLELPPAAHDLTDAEIHAFASRVITKADRERPADALLRQELKAGRSLTRAAGARISRAVFAFYRWRGWLESNSPLAEQIQQAQGLAQDFARHPEKFADSELVERAVPPWLRDEMEVTPAWARVLQAEPRLWLRARQGQGHVLTAQLADCRPYGAGEGALIDALEYTGSQDLFRTPEFHAGAFEVQDICSQAVGLIAAPQPGETWWDACAGEGGKLLHLSDLMQNRGLIWATDKADWRLKKLQRRTARARAFNYRLKKWAGGPSRPVKTMFDGVLVDAPCSGIGTWQRNPHARWTTQPQDVRELAAIQKQLLAVVAPALKPGGKLIYAVCSPARAETIEVVAEFEQKFDHFSPMPFANPLVPGSTPSAQLLLRPEETGGNAMFIAAWERRGA